MHACIKIYTLSTSYGAASYSKACSLASTFKPYVVFLPIWAVRAAAALQDMPQSAYEAYSCDTLYGGSEGPRIDVCH
jgi:hypothetical protein